LKKVIKVPTSPSTKYTIVGGKVDENTFQGWQIYQDIRCGQCHGDSGQGAPALSLIEVLKTRTKEQFVDIVISGKGAMPPFYNNIEVVENIDKIYAYLKARSDGALGEGMPEKQ
jgi:mono/diheme cytochrome c family protein